MHSFNSPNQVFSAYIIQLIILLSWNIMKLRPVRSLLNYLLIIEHNM